MSDNNYIADNNIVIAKTAIASTTAKVTKLLSEVHYLKISNINIIDQLEDFSSQLININNLVYEVSNNLNNDFENLNISFNNLYNSINNSLLILLI